MGWQKVSLLADIKTTWHLFSGAKTLIMPHRSKRRERTVGTRIMWLWGMRMKPCHFSGGFRSFFNVSKLVALQKLSRPKESGHGKLSRRAVRERETE